MIEKRVSWTSLKSISVSKGISIQTLEDDPTKYTLLVPDSGILYNTFVLKTEPRNSEQIDFEDNFKASSNKKIFVENLPFASKSLANGKKLYKREHGLQHTLSTGSNAIIFTVPYNWAKIVGLEILGGSHLDTCDLMVLDSTTGTYTGIPDYQLNQFGYSVNIAKDYYREENAYDADLYINMQVKIIYNSVDNKTIGINFNLSEVK